MLPKAFIEPLVLPWGYIQGTGHSNNPAELLLGRSQQPSHLAALGAILLQEVVELGTGCPLAGGPAQAF